jgi:glycosyltransferase involved in cell wall biosynthesis
MVAMWDRFDMRLKFHINSDANRFEFILWYIWEFLPARTYQLPPLPPEITSSLAGPVRCHQDLPRFWYGIWNRYFRDDNRYDIFTEEGYYFFLYFVCYRESIDRGVNLLQPLSAKLKSELNSRQPGIGGGDIYLSRALHQVWRSSDVYKTKYPNFSNQFVVESFIFDQIIHTYARDGMDDNFSKETVAWWRKAMHPRFPRLSRFLFELARHSKKFGSVLKENFLTEARYAEIIAWFDRSVLPEFPGLAALTPGSASSESKPSLTAPSNRGPRPRREIANKAATLLPTRDETIDILVIGPYSSASGLGSGIRRSVGALEKCGCNYRVLDLFFDSPAAPVETEVPRPYNGEQVKTNLWHFNGEYITDVISSYYPLAAGRRNIGYFFWETAQIPICHELGQDAVDEIWTPSEFVRQIYSGASVPVVNVGTSVELPATDGYLDRSHFGLRADEVVFMFSYDAHSVIHRKNPAAIVRAFLKAFGGGDYPVRLVLKTQNSLTSGWEKVLGRGEELFELCGYDKRITVIDKTMTLQELYSLKNCCDCYVSLHRSEGFGYGPAEAMALGKAVIMSDYSANTEFGNKENALMVPGKLVPIIYGEYLYWRPTMMWFDPDIDVAADAMMRVYKDPKLREALGAAAKVSINRDFGVDAMAAKYRRRLTELGIPCG